MASSLKNSLTQSPISISQIPEVKEITEIKPELNALQKSQIHKQKIIDIEKSRNNDFSSLAYDELRRKEDPYKIVGGRNNHIVKQFDQICRKAKIATIWDKQMEERKMMEGMYTNKEKRLDEMMELERLKEIKYIEDREKINKRNKIQSQKAIIEQIHDNDFERNRKREEIEREKILMLKQLERMKEEDKQILVQKKIEKEEKIKEFVHALDMMNTMKKKKILAEKEEDLKIKKFNLEKDAREERLLEEKKRIAQQREKDTQALRDKQEKQKDKLDELNEIKAKKAMIEIEIKEKKKLEEENEKRAKLVKEMIEANNLMLKIKKSMGEKEIEKDKEIFEKNELDKKRQEEEEKIKKRLKIEKMLENKIELERQILDKEKREKNKRHRELEEGKKIKKEMEKEKNIIIMVK